MLKDELPDDLVSFLESDRHIDYDPTTCEIGAFTLRPLGEIEPIEMIVSSADERSTSRIRGIDLIKTCTDYAPRGMLVYIPSLRKYGSYDGEKRSLITFRSMAWSDFLADPARFINSGWNLDTDIAEETFSDRDTDRIVEVCSAASSAEAGLLCAILEQSGIRAQTVGASLNTAVGWLPPGEATAPRVWVREGDAGRARQIVAEWNSRRNLTGNSIGDRKAGEENIVFACQECGESIAFSRDRRGHVETCPACGNFVDVPNKSEELPENAVRAALKRSSISTHEPAAVGQDVRTTRQLWLEVVAVLFLAYVPSIMGTVIDIIGGVPTQRHYSVNYHLFGATVQSLQMALPMLLIMSLSGDPWRRFGIVRPRWMADAMCAFAILIVTNIVYVSMIRVLPPSLLSNYGTAHAARSMKPHGFGGIALLLVAQAAVALAEELVTRAYLITRLQRLLSSTWLAVGITTALFASCHIYQGVRGTISAAVAGLVSALAFCWFRRLWPLCLAHAAHNILLYLT